MDSLDMFRRSYGPKDTKEISLKRVHSANKLHIPLRDYDLDQDNDSQHHPKQELLQSVTTPKSLRRQRNKSEGIFRTMAEHSLNSPSMQKPGTPRSQMQSTFFQQAPLHLPLLNMPSPSNRLQSNFGFMNGNGAYSPRVFMSMSDPRNQLGSPTNRVMMNPAYADQATAQSPGGSNFRQAFQPLQRNHFHHQSAFFPSINMPQQPFSPFNSIFSSQGQRFNNKPFDEVDQLDQILQKQNAVLETITHEMNHDAQDQSDREYHLLEKKLHKLEERNRLEEEELNMNRTRSLFSHHSKHHSLRPNSRGNHFIDLITRR